MLIRDITSNDSAEWLAMRREMWPDGDDHDVEIAAFFAELLEEPEDVLVVDADGVWGMKFGLLFIAISPGGSLYVVGLK